MLMSSMRLMFTRSGKSAQKRTYSNGKDTIAGLLGLAGIHEVASADGRHAALDLLHSKSMRYVPGQLANAIIAEHDLDPKVYERLRGRIREAVDLPNGWESIAEEFGIDT